MPRLSSFPYLLPYALSYKSVKFYTYRTQGSSHSLCLLALFIGPWEERTAG